ncbi:hypothetical protein RPIT_05945 [Tessaracoccus flavus]|uniref:PTS EIIA type-1 domain-containing protein n=2 Tax=Tessaracoccus flavus TaxID=1610493 RepID=A0A1Q2CE55_9ACTN|nr:hypothetical protein RPIT_05945 [Tessaracoccus flavus]
MMLEVLAPCPGHVIAMSEVDDPVFSVGAVGPGVGIEPRPGQTAVVSPVDGVLIKLSPHAFIVLVDDEIGVLVHIGINTVRLDGEGFELLAAEGDRVEAGTPVVSWDPGSITDPDMRDTVIVAVMDQEPDSLRIDEVNHDVDAGRVLFRLV